MLAFKNTPESINRGDSQTKYTGRSPFQHDVTFKITGFAFVYPTIDGMPVANARQCPVFTTSIGENLFVTMLTRPRIDRNGNKHEPNGSFNREFKQFLAEYGNELSIGEFLQKAVEKFSNRQLVIRCENFVATRYRNGNRQDYLASIVHIDFLENRKTTM